MKLGEVPQEIDQLPKEFVGDDKPMWGEKFTERINAATRTFKRRKEAQMVRFPRPSFARPIQEALFSSVLRARFSPFFSTPQVKLGEVSSNYQFSTERKRILNSSWEPSFDDNVKQDMSIDVYNREADELANS